MSPIYQEHDNENSAVKKREVTYFIFEKTADIDLQDAIGPKNWTSKAFRELETSRQKAYISHSTRAYKLNGSLYFTTRLSAAIYSSTAKPGATLSRLELNESDVLGSDLVLEDQAQAVVYLVYDKRQLYVKNQYKTMDVQELNGAPVLALEDELFKFSEVHFPMTRFLFGERGDLSSCSKIPADCQFSMGAQANFSKPTWFEQSSRGRIVVPGSDISDFLRICVYVKPSSLTEEEFPDLYLTGISVELQELLVNVSSDVDIGQPSKFNWVLKRKTILETFDRSKVENMAFTTLNGGRTYQIPSTLYNCKLPNVAPTSFTSGLTRSYAIKLHLRLEWGEKFATLSTFSEISVAKRIYHDVKRHTQDLSTIPKSSILHGIVLIQKLGRQPFPAPASTSFLQQACKDRGLQYRSHQTDIFNFHGESVAVTKIDAYGRQYSSLKKRFPRFRNALDKLGVFQMGYGPSFDPSEAYILCEVVESSKIQGEESENHLAGGVFLRLGDHRARYEFAHNPPTAPHRTDLGLKVDSLSFKLSHSRNWFNVSLTCKFRQPLGFKQPLGEKIVLPGMKISEFISLELMLPVALEELDIPMQENVHFTIKSVQVVVVEHLRSSKHDIPAFFDEFMTIESKITNETYYWSEFRGFSSNSTVVQAISTDLYDCTLPTLGPSFYSNEVYRDYRIYFLVHIQVGDKGPSEHLIVSQIIRIAAKTGDINSDKNAMPPSYEELSSHGGKV